MARLHCVAMAALLAVSLTACDSSGGDDNPPTTPATVSFPEDPTKAPSVPDPITDATAFVEEPCTSLTSEQRQTFDLGGGEADRPGYGQACFYPYKGDRWIRIAYNTAGLQGPYQAGPTLGTRWEPQVLDGYPAVATYTVDRVAIPPVPPSCDYVVGVNDFLLFSVVAQDTDGSSECGLAKKIAAAVLATIKEHR